jgi:phosphotransferase system enzyme I (PtsI)
MAYIEEVVLRGLPISKGIGIGFPIFFSPLDDHVPAVSISEAEVEEEIVRYRQALSKSRGDLEKLQRMSMQEGPPEVAAILGTHLEMMQDPLITTVIEEKIRQMEQNTRAI